MLSLPCSRTVFGALSAWLTVCGCSKPARIEPTKQASAICGDAAQGAAACVGLGGLPARPDAKNVFGKPLRACPSKQRTGFNRNGYCNTGPSDHGVHVVCARVSEAFLTYTGRLGNDLTTPRGDFQGLQPGDGWCLCAERWREAQSAGLAPPVYLEATDARALDFVDRDALTHQAVALPENSVELN
jgi:uncharacterized protein